ncbi:hypothetical protein K1719_044726 [Acacia pycnantha]|nr:hypothetical protein K1719_044726 [Acacia pycnantha]
MLFWFSRMLITLVNVTDDDLLQKLKDFNAEIFPEGSSLLRDIMYNWVVPESDILTKQGRKSTKKVRSITELQEQVGNLNWISCPAPLSGIEHSSSRNFIAFDSRIEPTDQILNALEEDECHAVVLHGIRGIGKNELAKEVGRRAKEESESGRDRRPCLRLKIEEKILIIFDDVRKKLDLKAIGIPLDNKGCKMIVTENENLWKSAEDGVKKVEIQALSEEESWRLFFFGQRSWRLFKSVTGEIVDNDSDFKIVAEEIAGK